jgi:hypothetical protein
MKIVDQCLPNFFDWGHTLGPEKFSQHTQKTFDQIFLENCFKIEFHGLF